MDQKLEKAKEIMANKVLCLMEWQSKEVEKYGGKVMEGHELEFLLSLDGITKEEVLSTEEPYDSEGIFSIIEETKNKGLKGIMFFNENSWISEKDEAKLKEMGYYIREEGWQSLLWQEVYFSEEAFVRAEIAFYKNKFSSFASVAPFLG